MNPSSLSRQKRWPKHGRADEGEALKQVWDTSGRWTRYVESADTVLEALERAIPQFGNLEMLLRDRDEKD